MLPDETGSSPAFQLAREIDLASRAFASETVLEFTLDETAVVGIFYALQNVDTTYFELTLVPAEGQSLVLLCSQSLWTDQEGGGMWEQELRAGTYRLPLNADRGHGALAVYWGLAE